MRFFFALLCLSVFLAFPARADDVLREHRTDDPAAQLLDENKGIPQSIEEYATLYFENCTASNTEKSYDEYVATQCGCTAAKMPEFMTMNNMKALFTKTKEGDFQQGRVLMLAYMPCMYDSVYQFIFDGCYYNAQHAKLIRRRKVCECYARTMGNRVASKGEKMIPGFTAGGFNSARAVPNPLVHILTDPYFSSRADYEFDQCVMTESYGWGK